MDERDRRIVIAIVSQWADHGRCTVRQVKAATGYSLHSIMYRLHGWSGIGNGQQFIKPTGGLIAAGWVAQGEGSAALLIGPRFGGMQRQSGRMYERDTDVVARAALKS